MMRRWNYNKINSVGPGTFCSSTCFSDRYSSASISTSEVMGGTTMNGDESMNRSRIRWKRQVRSVGDDVRGEEGIARNERVEAGDIISSSVLLLAQTTAAAIADDYILPDQSMMGEEGWNNVHATLDEYLSRTTGLDLETPQQEEIHEPYGDPPQNLGSILW